MSDVFPDILDRDTKDARKAVGKQTVRVIVEKFCGLTASTMAVIEIPCEFPDAVAERCAKAARDVKQECISDA